VCLVVYNPAAAGAAATAAAAQSLQEQHSTHTAVQTHYQYNIKSETSVKQ